MGFSRIHRRLKVEGVVYCPPSSYDITTFSVGDTISFSSAVDLLGSTASGYSFASGEITLPSGHWYLVKGAPQVRFASQTGEYRYEWQTSGGTSLGRRGTLLMQEEPKLFGGDELAVCLIDVTSAAQTIKLVILSASNITSLNSTVYPTYNGNTRAEIWKL